MSELEITEAIYEAGATAAASYLGYSEDAAGYSADAYDAASDVIDAAAPLIVATELRRLLAELESGRYGSTSAMVACVRRRIGALDKQGGQQ